MPALLTTPSSLPFQATTASTTRDVVLVGDVGGLAIHLAAAARPDLVGAAASRSAVRPISMTLAPEATSAAWRLPLADPAAPTGDQIRPIVEGQLHSDPFRERTGTRSSMEPQPDCGTSGTSLRDGWVFCVRQSCIGGCATGKRFSFLAAQCARPSSWIWNACRRGPHQLSRRRRRSPNP